MDDAAQTHFGAPITHFGHYRPEVCIAGPKVMCNGDHHNVSRHLQIHIGWANGAVRKRRKEAGSTFIWPVIRIHR